MAILGYRIDMKKVTLTNLTQLCMTSEFLALQKNTLAKLNLEELRKEDTYNICGGYNKREVEHIIDVVCKAFVIGSILTSCLLNPIDIWHQKRNRLGMVTLEINSLQTQLDGAGKKLEDVKINLANHQSQPNDLGVQTNVTHQAIYEWQMKELDGKISPLKIENNSLTGWNMYKGILHESGRKIGKVVVGSMICAFIANKVAKNILSENSFLFKLFYGY